MRIFESSRDTISKYNSNISCNSMVHYVAVVAQQAAEGCRLAVLNRMRIVLEEAVNK